MNRANLAKKAEYVWNRYMLAFFFGALALLGMTSWFAVLGAIIGSAIGHAILDRSEERRTKAQAIAYEAYRTHRDQYAA